MAKQAAGAGRQCFCEHCLVSIQHTAQTAFRLLLPDAGSSSVSQSRAHLLPLIPASPQHMANYVLNSSLNFCAQT